MIYIDTEEELKNNISFKFLCLYSLIIFIWILEDQLIESFYLIFQDLDFWMIELFIISYLNKKIFKVQIYNHQMFAFFFSLFASLLKVGTIILSFCDKRTSTYTGYLPIYYIRNNPFLRITFGIMLYLLLILLRSIVNISLKWYMDIKYISPNKILMLYGIFGTIVYLIIIFIVTTFNCENNPIKEDYNIYTYVCKVNYTNNSYIDSYNDYFDNWNNFNNRIREIIVIIFGIFAFFFNKLYTILIIKYLSPVHVIFSVPINFILEKIVMITYTLILRNISENKEGYKYSFIFATDNDYKYAKFSLDISGDILSLIGFLIYLEVIRLSCKQFRYNIRSNIIKRSAVELMVNNDNSEDSVDSKISENNSSIENGYDQIQNLDNSENRL